MLEAREKNLVMMSKNCIFCEHKLPNTAADAIIYIFQGL